ncbi:hypothetical protein T492DRAFT_845482 [Pavlovales sp. CCMP2436]|nr:hypothetical protein T492DRAFT_845482 [Pavlovales sp. CCMP2436]
MHLCAVVCVGGVRGGVCVWGEGGRRQRLPVCMPVKKEEEKSKCGGGGKGAWVEGGMGGGLVICRMACIVPESNASAREGEASRLRNICTYGRRGEGGEGS